MNALSTAGFSLQTTKNGKGQVALTITGHVSINAQSVVPMEFYSADADEVDYYTVEQILGQNVTSDFEDTSVAASGALEVNLTAATGYELDVVTVLMGGVDITETAYDAGVVTIASVTGNVQIVATAKTE
jgi:hypothetical protein